MNNRNYPPEMIEAAKAELARRKQSAQIELDRRSKENSFTEQLYKIPGYAAGAALKLPGQLIDLAKEVPEAIDKSIEHPIDAVRDISGGVARGSQNLASALLEGGEYLTRKGAEGISRAIGNPVQVPKWNARQFMGLEGDNKIDLGKYLESNNPNKFLSVLGQGLGGLAGANRGVLGLVGANAINTALQANPGERLKAGIEGAINTGLPIGILKGANALRPSRMLAGNLTPEKLQSNFEAAQGTNTGLGDIIGSPSLKRLYENVLPRVPFSKADQIMQNTASQLINKGEQHLENINAGLPEGDKTKYFQDALKKASIQAIKEKNENFKNVNDIAEKARISVPRDNFQQKAKDILDEINKSRELAREFDPKLLEDLKAYAKNPEGNSLRLSNIFKGKLNDRATEFYLNGKNYEYGIVKDLRDALGTDIDTTIKSSRNTDLKEAYDKAMTEYGTKYKPFEDPDVTKFTREGGDPDIMLSHFLRTGANDRSNLLTKVIDKLPSEAKNLPASMYLSRAIEDGSLNPIKFRTLYKNLGQKQRETLISDKEMRDAISKYTKLVDMNTEAFQTMFNPKTGQRISDLIPTMGAMAGYSMAGGGLPGLLGGAIGLGVTGLAGRAATGLLTNPAVRESLVKAIIKAKTKQK